MDVRIILHQSGYPAILINKEFELAEKYHLKTMNPQKHSNEQPLTYVSTYTKTPELSKNPDQFKINERIINIRYIKCCLMRTTIKNLKTNPNLNTQHMGSQNAKIKDVNYVILSLKKSPTPSKN